MQVSTQGSVPGAESMAQKDPRPTENGVQKADPPSVDAGLRSLDHYKRALPRWRYTLRKQLLPLIRWETPYLAYFQQKTRTPALDNYFAITANLGTHTFFMVFLPMLFWFGFAKFGKGLVHILALGVLFTSFIKDMLSLPRPLSPPLHRITMSGHVALEYGFPSTHSTNAVSVAVYAALMLRDSDLAPGIKLTLEGLSYFYAFSIVVGRLYCGMHGFLDVIVGSMLGAAISWVEFYYGPPFDIYMRDSSWIAPAISGLIVVIFVRIHPEPADDCPCFDDTVAFSAVIIGVEAGSWHYAQTTFMWPHGEYPAGDLEWYSIIARLVSGVCVIFAWREVMKPTLLKVLPHIFRVIETYGLNLPRRYFIQASEYGKIPEVLRLRTDNVIPSVSDFPGIVANIKKARRGRSISIGPQSAADAYETLAYRERRRRESISSQTSIKSKSSLHDIREQASNGAAGVDQTEQYATASGVYKGSLAKYEEQMGEGTVVVENAASPVVDPSSGDAQEPDIFVGRQDELGEKEMFEKLVKPRVRYDVEVVTKLIVYAGIGWFAVEIIPVMFELIGLGVGLPPLRA